MKADTAEAEGHHCPGRGLWHGRRYHRGRHAAGQAEIFGTSVVPGKI